MYYTDKILLLFLLVSLLNTLSTITTGSGGVMQSIYSNGVVGFKTTVFYYGWLTTSNILGLRMNIAVVSGSTRILPGGDDYTIIQELRSRGVEVYAYLHDGDTPIGAGTSFKNMVYDNQTGTLDERVQYWIDYIEGLIDRYIGVVDGVFIDECDPGYFGTTDPENQYLQAFSRGLENITEYARTHGLKVFINGVRAYAGLGDYYLWEDFVSIYNETTRDYVLDEKFFNEGDNNPYQWINGISKYNYLKKHGLLGKTIALSFADKDSKELAKYGYYTARILGLAGWALAPINIYSTGGPIIKLDVYETGPRISDPLVDSENRILEGVFTAGTIKVDLGRRELITPFTSYKRVEIDCKPTEHDLNTTKITGTYTIVNSYGYLATPGKLLLFINASWTTSSTGGLLHVYIDRDGDENTGYRIRGIGADYLVEVQASRYEYIAEYTGSGMDWSWNEIGAIPMCIDESTGYIVFELEIPGNYYSTGSKIILATMYDWSDDAVIGPLNITDLTPIPPTIYEDTGNLSKYMGVIESIEIEPTTMIVYSDAPHGSYINYTFITPFKEIALVMKNDTTLNRKNTPSFSGEGYYVEHHGNYTKIIIVVKHASPVIIRIYSEKIYPADEPLCTPLIILASIMLLLVAQLAKKR